MDYVWSSTRELCLWQWRTSVDALNVITFQFPHDRSFVVKRTCLGLKLRLLPLLSWSWLTTELMNEALILQLNWEESAFVCYLFFACRYSSLTWAWFLCTVGMNVLYIFLLSSSMTLSSYISSSSFMFLLRAEMTRLRAKKYINSHFASSARLLYLWYKLTKMWKYYSDFNDNECFIVGYLSFEVETRAAGSEYCDE